MSAEEIEREKIRRDAWREGELAGRENQRRDDARRSEVAWLRDPMNAIALAQPILEELFKHLGSLADEDGVVHEPTKYTFVIGPTGGDAQYPLTFHKVARAEEACRFAQEPLPTNVDTDEIRDILETGRFGMDDDDDYDKVRKLCDELDRLRAAKERAPSTGGGG